jgi:hypothetical protein
VEEAELDAFNEYAIANEGWYEDSKRLVLASGEGTLVSSDYTEGGRIASFVYEMGLDENGPRPVPPSNPPFYPIWHFSPPPFTPTVIKVNIGSRPDLVKARAAVSIAREAVFGPSKNDPNPLATFALKEEDHQAFHDQFASSDTVNAFVRPHGVFVQPLFREIYNDTSELVGYIQALILWDRYFVNLLPEGVEGIVCVLENTCGQAFTYLVDGNSVSVRFRLDDARIFRSFYSCH